MSEEELIENLTKKAETMTIRRELFDEYKVRRGLRNPDTQKGVLVGLTTISRVVGTVNKGDNILPVDGELYYRGVSIQDIVERARLKKGRGFEETAFLLLFGEMPDEQELGEFTGLLSERRKLQKGFWEDVILKSPSNNIMNKLARSVLTLYSLDPKADDTSIKNLTKQSIDLIAKFPTIVAYSYHTMMHNFRNESLHIHIPGPELSTAESFLHMLRPDKEYTSLEAEVLDLLLILHAEHGGGNNSTFSVRSVTSTMTDTYSAISAGIGSLKGPLHGGANERVIAMMKDIMKNVPEERWQDDDSISDYIERIIRGEAGDNSGKIYGMGHSVYTLSDPRAVILKKEAKRLALEGGRMEEFKLYDKVEKLAPEVFKRVKKSDKKISANMDFYSGFVYMCLDIPHELYTPLFAIARVAGWCAHRIEEVLDGRLMRPSFMYVGQKGLKDPTDSAD